jgi:hypothetical protein
VQVEELGRARRVIAGQRMGRDVVDLLVPDPNDATVVQRLEILLASPQHWRSPRPFVRRDPIVCGDAFSA